MCVYVSGSNAIISITHAGLAGGRSSHCERLSQNELLSSLALTQSATGKCRRCWNWNWSWRRRRRRHTHVTFIEQCPTRSQRRGPHADNICADICALQSAVSCAQNVAILVSRFVIPPPLSSLLCSLSCLRHRHHRSMEWDTIFLSSANSRWQQGGAGKRDLHTESHLSALAAILTGPWQTIRLSIVNWAKWQTDWPACLPPDTFLPFPSPSSSQSVFIRPTCYAWLVDCFSFSLFAHFR